jgi:hypothetical protein
VIKPIFHFNINCSKFAKPLEFYKRLGIKVEIAVTLDGDPGESRALGVPRAIGKAAIMKLGEVHMARASI